MKFNDYDYFDVTKKILYICENEYNYFFKKANVVGLGLGYKTVNGFNTFEKCIKIFVCKKIPSKKLLKKDLISSRYKGIKTDLIESGLLLSGSLTDKIRPTIGGYSVGPFNEDSSGSLGCLVKDRAGKYILSSNHVLANENKLSLGTSILQPSFVDDGKYPRDEIAKLSSYIPLKFQTKYSRPVNYVDCAIAKILNNYISSSAIAFIGKPKGIKKPILKENIQKVGSTTELTFGQIYALDCTCNVNYDGDTALFKNQIVTTAISDVGDSGCVLLDNNNYVLGLLVSVGKTLSTFNPIEKVLNSFRVNLVTD